MGNVMPDTFDGVSFIWLIQRIQKFEKIFFEEDKYRMNKHNMIKDFQNYVNNIFTCDKEFIYEVTSARDL